MSKNPRTVTCAICGRDFPTNQPTAFACSPECKAERKRRRMRGRPHSYGDDRECEMCGTMYTPRYRDQRTCGRECGRFLVKGYGGMVLASDRLHGQHSELMVCASCGDLIPRRHPGAIYCEACSGTACLGGTWIRGVKVCEDCGVPILVYKGSGNKCDECADAIKRDRARAEKRDHKHRYGSHCHKSRARKYGCYYEPVNRFKVFERDHWTCHICGKPIPWGTAPGTPMSPTIDHVWPMSKGGPHSYENVRAAHMICNSLKSDSTYPMGYMACNH